MENQQQEKEKEKDSLLSLFDTLWFYHPILFHNPPPPPPPPAPAPEPIPIKVVQRIRSHRRSLSDEQLLHIPSSSTATNSHSKLQTILSGKESTVLQENTSIEIKKTGNNNNNKHSKRRLYRRRGSSSTKSLSDLEFEELKGFMDLGFTFSDAETDPRLMSIVPGLRRRVACDDEKFESERHGCDDDDEEGGGGVVRPYLSEAWEVEEERRLRNWKIPAPVEGVDMKDCLRLWAQAVASTVR
ncbi:uncharacterized protein LOC120281187 [Dioscorea cayenensis subsp. rotundata]|uniref:Uncharacterized protein LOC120281187 n=1 Tax=Dioscorea cayennensis subsp. rotundata TaxID=55577 RepID=A0AB40CZY2_DIOCR|nr:uncharacterized protein LOC120281187 [Dioscorea cayenensis subsp. rotundata]